MVDRIQLKVYQCNNKKCASVFQITFLLLKVCFFLMSTFFYLLIHLFSCKFIIQAFTITIQIEHITEKRTHENLHVQHI